MNVQNYKLVSRFIFRDQSLEGKYLELVSFNAHIPGVQDLRTCSGAWTL